MPNNWRVTGQRQTSTLNGAGGFTDVIEVSFETIPEGVAQKINVPLNLYSPEYVAAQVDQRVATIQAIHNL